MWKRQKIKLFIFSAVWGFHDFGKMVFLITDSQEKDVVEGETEEESEETSPEEALDEGSLKLHLP